MKSCICIVCQALLLSHKLSSSVFSFPLKSRLTPTKIDGSECDNIFINNGHIFNLLKIKKYYKLDTLKSCIDNITFV